MKILFFLLLSCFFANAQETFPNGAEQIKGRFFKTPSNYILYAEGGNIFTLAKAVDLATKQATLISGTNIKTVEGQVILGAGNIDLSQTDVGFPSTSVFNVDQFGMLRCSIIANLSTLNNCALYLANPGINAVRDMADDKSVMSVNQKNLGSTGNILELQFNSETVAYFNRFGRLNLKDAVLNVEAPTWGQVKNRVITNTGMSLPQTAASLNDGYPSAIDGDIVVAPYVGSGMIYIKTSVTGVWLPIASTGILTPTP